LKLIPECLYLVQLMSVFFGVRIASNTSKFDEKSLLESFYRIDSGSSLVVNYFLADKDFETQKIL